MKALVDDLRRMTGVGKAQYEIDGTAFWSDADLERALEKRVSERLFQVEVVPITTVAEGADLEVLSGQVELRGSLDTETAVVTTIAGNQVKGATLHEDGHIDYAENMISTPTLLTGITYDLSGAAADVLTDWASAVKEGYDLTADGQGLKRSQRHAQLLTQAAAFRARAVPGTITLRRTDVPPKRGSTRKGMLLRNFERRLR
jgi:hypothetical protein